MSAKKLEPEQLPLARRLRRIARRALEIGTAQQPFSRESRQKAPRIRDARVVHSVRPYCAVGCGLNVYVKDGRVLDIEGNPVSPISHGTLRPKGAATFQYTVNPNHLTRVLYRAPYSDHWEERSLDWAMEQIALRVKETRDATFVERLADGREVNHTLALASLGGATLDVEENYLMTPHPHLVGVAALLQPGMVKLPAPVKGPLQFFSGSCSRVKTIPVRFAAHG
jgi:formate dehydrogenase major subunit